LELAVSCDQGWRMVKSGLGKTRRCYNDTGELDRSTEYLYAKALSRPSANIAFIFLSVGTLTPCQLMSWHNSPNATAGNAAGNALATP
jgi:hypothetical protein